MIIGGLQKCSLLDFPGKIAAIVFTQGCNFRCPFCHNTTLVLPAKFESSISEESFFDFLVSRKKQLDGVVISGGEPTLHKDLDQFIDKIINLGFAIKLDTNGTNFVVLNRLISQKKLNYIAMDLKHSMNLYHFACGTKINQETISNSIQAIINSGIDYEFRTTVVPGIHTVENMKDIRKMLNGAKRYILQKFIPDNALDENLRTHKSPSDDVMKELKLFFSETIPEVSIR